MIDKLQHNKNFAEHPRNEPSQNVEGRPVQLALAGANPRLTLVSGGVLVLMTLFLPLTIDSCGEPAGAGYQLVLGTPDNWLPTWSGFFFGPLDVGRGVYLLSLALAVLAILVAIPSVQAKVTRLHHRIKPMFILAGSLALFSIADFFSLIQFGFLQQVWVLFMVPEREVAHCAVPEYEVAIARTLTPLAIFLIAWAIRSNFFRRYALIRWLLATGGAMALWTAAHVGKIAIPFSVTFLEDAGLGRLGATIMVVSATVLLLAVCLRLQAWQRKGALGWFLSLASVTAIFLFLISGGAAPYGSEEIMAVTIFAIPLSLLPVSFWYRYRACGQSPEWPIVRRGLILFCVPAALFSLAYFLLFPLTADGAIPWGFALYFVGLQLIFRGVLALERKAFDAGQKMFTDDASGDADSDHRAAAPVGPLSA